MLHASRLTFDAPPNPFDELAPFYEAWFDTPVGAKAGELERALLLRLAAPRRGERALEVGVGTGYFARVMAGAGAQVGGVDLSEPILREAARHEPPIALMRADAAALPFLPAQFDLVYTVTMLEFVPDPARALAEMWQALRPGGRLVVAVLNAWSPWARRKAPPFDQAHFYSPPELRHLLGRYGRVQMAGTIFFLPDGRLLRYADRLERLGHPVLWPFGAFLVARVDKTSSQT